MTVTSNRIFLARLAGQPVYDPHGDPVGKLRDLVVTMRSAGAPPRVLGLVVEVLGRRRVFVPMTRLTSVDAGQLIITGVLNMRRFEQRSTEILVYGQLFDRNVRLRHDDVEGEIFDIGMEQGRNHEWFVTSLALRERGKRLRRGQTHVAEWHEAIGLDDHTAQQGADNLLATMDDMRPVDLADALRDLPVKRRLEIVRELDDERLADVLEEMDGPDQVPILASLDPERAADVLEEMSPDDAADLIGELPTSEAEALLALMEPEDADDVRRLMTYDDLTAGGMMTTDPVILPTDATIAEALARVRVPEISPALASMVFVCRPPLETPTGRFIGVAHFQALLREPPSTLVSAVCDSDIDWPRPEATVQDVVRLLAAYDMVACPVVDDDQHLVGAVTVDDALDHLLPEGWRDERVDVRTDAEIEGDDRDV